MPKQTKHHEPMTVFISHAAADASLARRIRNLLRSRLDVKVYATEDLSAGENWESQLRRQLWASDFVVALWSPDSVRSKYVLQDLGAAWALRKPIISLATRPDIVASLPVPQSEYQIIELKNLDNPPDADDLAQQFSRALGVKSAA